MLIDDLNEVKVEPEDFHDFNEDPPKENEIAQNKVQLLPCFDKSSSNRTGEFVNYT